VIARLLPHPSSSRRVGRRLSHATRVVTTQFDARSRPVSVLDDSVNAIGVSNWGYDAVNRRVSASFTNGVASAFTYDLNNRLTSIQHASDVSLLPGSADLFDFSFGYDVVGNLLYKKDHIRTDRSEAYAYDDLNRLTLMQRGVPNVADPTIIATPIDDARMPWKLDWTDAGGDPTLDQRGNWASVERTQRVGGNDTTESQARSLDAVGGAANEYYHVAHDDGVAPFTEYLEYDAAGNLVATHLLADMNCDGQLTAADIDAFVLAMTNPETYASTYPDCLAALGDVNGDGVVSAADVDPFVAMITAGASYDLARQFAYDEENRLVSVTVDGVPTEDYLYDALGRRILTHDLVTQLRTRHVYGAGFAVLAEYESSDNWETEDLAREFLWGERFPEPLVLIDWTTGPEKAYHYLHDHLGSVIALVDAGDPEAKPEPIPPRVVERYTYDPYGTTYIETWKAELPAGCTTPSECGCESDGAGGYWCESDKSAYGNPFAWTAQRYDAGVGLYAFPFRGYSPSLGRFLQRDPLGYIDGPNLYEYARSMPTVLTDPMGLIGCNGCSCDCSRLDPVTAQAFWRLCAKEDEEAAKKPIDNDPDVEPITKWRICRIEDRDEDGNCVFWSRRRVRVREKSVVVEPGGSVEWSESESEERSTTTGEATTSGGEVTVGGGIPGTPAKGEGSISGESTSSSEESSSDSTRSEETIRQTNNTGQRARISKWREYDETRKETVNPDDHSVKEERTGRRRVKGGETRVTVEPLGESENNPDQQKAE
jgi:RHS repeat-associated protein